MKWRKFGLIFNSGCFDWSRDSALQPTPLKLDDRIRVFVGSRDDNGVSRIGYADLDVNDPAKVIGYSKAPVLDIGDDGCFDENGVVPSAVVKLDGVVYLFYAGYQLGTKVRFSVLGGLAISVDDGKTFKRIKKTPVFERNDAETLFRVPHSVVFKDNVWKAWYGGGDHFIRRGETTLPAYDIRYTESINPEYFNQVGRVLLETQNDEYRLGRPFFYEKTPGEYVLFYGYSNGSVQYKLGAAFSKDCLNWVRKDDEFNLFSNDGDWDFEMTAYPSVVDLNGRVYLLYNGNNYGQDGFGLAELIEW